MNVQIDEIIMKRRVRHDMGNINGLVESIRRYGLMNPIVLNTNKELIAGHRRLQAVKQLGWKSIPALIVNTEDTADKLEMELEENVQRKELTPEEISEGYNRLERLRHPGIFHKFFQLLAGLWRRLLRLLRIRH
ncbi:MAG: ParB/RepB/Spo0J family partition protein [Spirochaetales bacterium]|nr:ParB/RepB/Spo0J family partition protein [Spirochaetales bacterium]MCF7937300.1 ParB/RepB/Spo0J family partition protein [Spirochaetales bacterium]